MKICKGVREIGGLLISDNRYILMNVLLSLIPSDLIVHGSKALEICGGRKYSFHGHSSSTKRGFLHVASPYHIAYLDIIQASCSSRHPAQCSEIFG